MMSRLSLIPPHRDPVEEALRLHDGVSTDTREITIVASPTRPSGSTPGTSSGSDQTGEDAESSATSGAAASTNVGLNELLGGAPRRRVSRHDDGTPATGQLPETEAPERQPSRPKRSSVPSWDEIVFGTRGD